MNTDYKSFGEISDTGTFVGKYFEDIKLAAIVSFITDSHLLLNGDPGCGKTEGVFSVALSIWETLTKFQRVNPTSNPEEIQGFPRLDVYKSSGKYQRELDDTIFDPKWKVVILDEITRSNDALMDIFMNLLDRNGIATKATVIATTNWLPQTKREAALMDRFNCIWNVPKTTQARGLVERALMYGIDDLPNAGGGIPSAEYVEWVREQKPDQDTAKVVSDFVDDLYFEAVNDGLKDDSGTLIRTFSVSNRHRKIWGKIMYRMSVYYNSNPTFVAVHPKAKDALKFCYVSQDESAIEDWQKFLCGGSDPIDSYIDITYVQAVQKIKEIVDSNPTQCAIEFGQFIVAKSNEVSQVFKDNGVSNPSSDDRFIELRSRLDKAFTHVVRGEDPLSN